MAPLRARCAAQVQGGAAALRCSEEGQGQGQSEGQGQGQGERERPPRAARLRAAALGRGEGRRGGIQIQRVGRPRTHCRSQAGRRPGRAQRRRRAEAAGDVERWGEQHKRRGGRQAARHGGRVPTERRGQRREQRRGQRRGQAEGEERGRLARGKHGGCRRQVPSCPPCRLSLALPPGRLPVHPPTRMPMPMPTRHRAPPVHRPRRTFRPLLAPPPPAARWSCWRIRCAAGRAARAS